MKERAARIAALGYDYDAREKVAADHCNLCGGTRWTVIGHRDRYGFAAPAVTCRRCGLTFLDPRMTEEAYAEFYGGIYRPLVSAYHGRRIDSQSILAEQREYAIEMARLVEPFLADRGLSTMLDVGGSTGVVARHFSKRFGLTATVLDPSPDELALAEDSGLEVIASGAEAWHPGERKFDVVGMFQSIDHLLDVNGTLAKIREVLSPDGIFIVDVVDFRAAYLKSWSTEAAVKIDHPFNLTEETAEAWLARTGFEILRTAYSEDRHLVGYVCRPAEPRPDALPDAEFVRRQFREMRYVQHTIRPEGGAD
jgi:SAM-dependent methyltransferase